MKDWRYLYRVAGIRLPAQGARRSKPDTLEQLYHRPGIRLSKQSELPEIRIVDPFAMPLVAVCVSGGELHRNGHSVDGRRFFPAVGKKQACREGQRDEQQFTHPMEHVAKLHFSPEKHAFRASKIPETHTSGPNHVKIPFGII